MFINNEIKRLKKEMEKLDTKLDYYTDLKVSYILGERDAREDYPDWNRIVPSEPMDYINWQINRTKQQLAECRKKIVKLYSKRSWIEAEYSRPLEEVDIIMIIEHDGSIGGIKL